MIDINYKTLRTYVVSWMLLEFVSKNEGKTYKSSMLICRYILLVHLSFDLLTKSVKYNLSFKMPVLVLPLKLYMQSCEVEIAQYIRIIAL